jgi:hypothetical protein
MISGTSESSPWLSAVSPRTVGATDPMDEAGALECRECPIQRDVVHTHERWVRCQVCVPQGLGLRLDDREDLQPGAGAFQSSSPKRLAGRRRHGVLRGIGGILNEGYLHFNDCGRTERNAGGPDHYSW